jgi:aspartate/methionine/tyrosine aminotransferase
MRWSKEHAAARYNLANSGLLACTLDELAPEGLEALRLPLNGHNPDGHPPLLAAIAARYGVAPGQVAVAQGASGANFLAFTALVEPGDEVLVEQPTYEPLLAALALLGARVRRFPRRFEDGYRPDLAALRSELGQGRPRLVVLTDPHNPSGVLLPPEDLQEAARLTAEAGAHLLIDEVYLDACGPGGGLDGAAPNTAGLDGAAGSGRAASRVHLGPHLLATNSLTKSYGLSGLRCGWVLCGTAALATRLRHANDAMAAGGPLPTEALAVHAFEILPRLAERARTLIDPSLARVHALLEEHADRLDCVLPPRSMTVFPRLRREPASDDLHDRLRQLDTSIVPGRFFEDPRAFRLGFVRGPEEVAQGLANLARALR